MGFFTFPGDQEHRKFNYRPIYYDKDEEERRQVFGKVDGRLREDEAEGSGGKKGEYKPGSYLRGSLRDGNYARRSATAPGQRFISLIGLVLLAVMLIYLIKFFFLLF
jgi:hypothetical protein